MASTLLTLVVALQHAIDCWGVSTLIGIGRTTKGLHLKRRFEWLAEPRIGLLKSV